MQNWKVELAKPTDFEWIKPLFKANESILGAADVVLWRYNEAKKKDPNKKDLFIVVRPFGFAHFLVKRDGTRTLYEVAVDSSQKRRGIGKALLDAIGYPMSLKTDADNPESNNFYRKLGFICVGSKFTNSGKKVNVYQRFG